MKLENEFTVDVPIETAWDVLTDIPLIAPCLPGARLTGQDGDVYSGRVKIKVGPVTAEYEGTADFKAMDAANRHVTIDAKGRDKRGSGNANALITADMSEVDGGTKVVIVTDLKIAGKVAQFGKGVIGDVSKKLIGQFVDCIEQKLEDDSGTPVDEVATASAELAAAAPNGSSPDVTPAAEPAAPASKTIEEPEEEMEALDLMDAAGGALLKRAAPVLAAVVAAIIAYIVIR